MVFGFGKSRPQHREIAASELAAMVEANQALVIDVREVEEFAAGHIPGALSIPVQELKARLKELKKSREVVAYCRGPYCVYADQAVALLRAKGRRARRLLEGFPEWRAAGLPVQAGGDQGEAPADADA